MSRLKPPVSDADHIAGPSDARVTLLEYGDLECPDCGRADRIVKRIQRETGAHLRRVFRHFPKTNIHPHALRAAEVAEAAAAQGKFWEMHDLLLENQLLLEDADLLDYAAQIGLDTERVKREMESHAHVARIWRDVESGVGNGVVGTPTYFINGRRFDDRIDFETLFSALERAAR